MAQVSGDKAVSEFTHSPCVCSRSGRGLRHSCPTPAGLTAHSCPSCRCSGEGRVAAAAPHSLSPQPLPPSAPGLSGMPEGLAWGYPHSPTTQGLLLGCDAHGILSWKPIPAGSAYCLVLCPETMSDQRPHHHGPASLGTTSLAGSRRHEF